jgi:hypothetical protein
MMTEKNKRGATRLARVLDQRIKEHGMGSFDPDFGEIQDDYSLLPDNFPKKIPQKDYSVCKHLSGKYMCRTNEIPEKKEAIEDGTHDKDHQYADIGEHHWHDMYYPSIKPNDRVMIVWVNGEAVVIDVIIKADRINKLEPDHE